MSTPTKPDAWDGGHKLPSHSLWQLLKQRAQPLTLEFCSQFFNDKMSIPEARKWLLGYGIKMSPTALSGFYNSMDMRLRYAAVQAQQSADVAKAELPADIEAATRERIAQHKFELSFMNLSESQRLQLIQIQQNEDGMKGNFALKKAKLDLDQMKFNRDSIALFIKWATDKEALQLATSNAPTADKTERLGQKLFGDLWK